MKIYIYFLMFCVLSCNSRKENIETNSLELSKIQLPKFDNWKESYSYPSVKRYFDEYTIKKNNLLGIYLNNKTFNLKNSLEEIEFEDYGVLYNIKTHLNWEKEKEHFEKQSSLKKMYLIKNKDTKEIISEIRDSNFEEIFSKPLLLDKYWINDNIFTTISLLQPYNDSPKDITIMVFNSLNIKNRVTYFGYYLNLNDFSSIETAKTNNEILVTKIEKLNRE